MITWKISLNLSPALDPEWEKLLEVSLGERVHEGRRRGFLLSRRALLECLQEQGRTLSISELRLKNYSTLEIFPELSLSLSHTVECGAAIVAPRKIYRSLGIDIERQDRHVKDSIIDRISHPADKRLRNIELWCLKEAVFKTLMNSGLFSTPVDFSSIQILDREWLHPRSKLSGEWVLQSQDSLMLAIATLKNGKLFPQDSGL